MDFQTGDRVMHATYGLGHVQAIEKHTVNETTGMYYMIQTADLTIWVPADGTMKNRLRYPTTATRFKKMLALLSSPAESLPGDRRQRYVLLLALLNDGGIEPLCKVIRDLTAHRRANSWNEYDNALMKRASKALIGEWSASLSITPREAEMEYHRLLEPKQN
jgi:RNA polymerase-interacting CarD/CdnL/TRCF family regulator